MIKGANRWIGLAAVFLLGFVGGAAISGMWRMETLTPRSAILPQPSTAGSMSNPKPQEPTLAETNEKRTKESEPLAPALESVLAIEDALARRHDLENLGLEWARTNVDNAIAALVDVREGADRQALIRGIFHFVSGQEPKWALKTVLRLEDLGDRIAARKELLAAWAPKYSAEDPKRDAYLLMRYGSGALGMKLLLTSPPQDELAVLWANSLEPKEGKVRFLTEIADGFVFRKSPAEALKLGEGLEGEEYVNFLEGFAGSYARQDGKAALQWSMQIADPVLRENLQQSITSGWVQKNPGEAKAYLQTLEEGSARESLMRAIAANFAETDTAAALAWIQELPTPAERKLVTGVVQDVAPVGIGTQLSLDGGFPTVSSVVATGSAAMSQQVQIGDRIVGVDSYGGGFVSTAGMELNRVVALIRGQPGTTVRLQVSKVNNHGFDPPRVVVLPRSQVLFSPHN